MKATTLAWFGSGIRAFEAFIDESLNFTGEGTATFDGISGATGSMAVFGDGSVVFGDPSAVEVGSIDFEGGGTVFFDVGGVDGQIDAVAIHDGTDWVGGVQGESSSGSTSIWNKFYGTPFTPRALANQIVDAIDSYGYRFEAARTGTIASFQPHIRLTTSSAAIGDYADGTGGTTTFTLYPDDGNGLPDTSGSPIATATYTPNLFDANGTSRNNPGGFGPAGDGILSFSNNHPLNFPTIALNASVVEGQVYHLLATNPSSTDYISLNHGFSTDHTGGPVRGPLAPTVEQWGITQKRPQSNDEWAEYTTRELASGAGQNRYESALVLTMDDGFDFGLAFADPRYDNDVTVAGTTQLRQLLTPSEDITVDQVQMHTVGGGTVNVIIEQSNGTGQLINQSVVTSGGADWAWDTASFGQITLQSGVEYQIRFEAVSGSVRHGLGRLGDESLGKLWPVAQSFAGLAQSSTNSGSTWSDIYIGTDIMGLAFRVV